MNTKYKFPHILIGILMTSILLGVSSCEKKLEQYPQDQFAEATFWTNETNAMIALAGVYRGGIRYNTSEQNNPTDWWSQGGIIGLDGATDNLIDQAFSGSNYARLTNGELVSSNVVVRAYWSVSYQRIATCSRFLENIDKVPMDKTRKKRMTAEARFIRACQYFYMSQFWGSVPLVTKTLTPDEANNVTKAPKTEIVQFVITELKESAIDLPRFKDIPASETGRASRQVALAFLGRLYLAEKKYTEASDAYKQIIDFGDNIIDPNYQTIFLASNENSKENIFSMQYYPGLAGNGVIYSAFPAMLGGNAYYSPLGSLADEYEFSDGTPFSYTDPRYNPKDIGANRDPRFRFSLLWNNSTFQGKIYVSHLDSTRSLDQLNPSKISTRTGYSLRKYLDESFTGDKTSGYGGNIPIIRYAEVLLSYLEAELEAGHAISQSLLDMTINKVRGRASVNLPAITQTDPVLLRPILRKERRVELAFEGLRYWDLLRWGIADQVLTGDFWGAPFPDSKTYADKSKKLDPDFRWWVTSKNFRKGQDEVWPVPESEVNINPKLR